MSGLADLMQSMAQSIPPAPKKKPPHGKPFASKGAKPEPDDAKAHGKPPFGGK